MSHDTALIATIAVSLALAFVFGFAASKLRLPPLVGYLLAGVAVGPFTPGFVADAHLAPQLAEIGVILLMFGVGMHLSVRDLWEVRKIALPGALTGMAVATALGTALGLSWGWPWRASVVFGLTLSVASTVVLLRGLEGRRRLESREGRIALGWLIVEDLTMVLVLVLVPALAGGPGVHGGGVWARIGWATAEIVVFGAFMALVGARLFPWILKQAERTGSRELFTVAVLAIALGVAFASAQIFGVSFALGAFVAGVVIHETDLSHRAALEALPLRDAFAVLFFVSVGMLFDPSMLIHQPLRILAVVGVLLMGKTLAAFILVRMFGESTRSALTVAASLAQIGEFSFILAGLAVSLGLLPEAGRGLVLAGALLSITLNPAVFALCDRVGALRERRRSVPR